MRRDSNWVLPFGSPRLTSTKLVFVRAFSSLRLVKSLSVSFSHIASFNATFWSTWWVKIEFVLRVFEFVLRVFRLVVDTLLAESKSDCPERFEQTLPPLTSKFLLKCFANDSKWTVKLESYIDHWWMLRRLFARQVG